MRVLAIIPARGGSKGIPRKNIRLLAGQPLIYYTLMMALKSKRLSEVMVSTEDSEIAEVVRKYKDVVPFMRPENLALDTTPSIDVAIQVLDTYTGNKTDFDAVMILQPTCPFRQADEIDIAIEIFQKEKSDSLISVRKVPDHFNPHWVFEETKNGRLSIATGDEKLISRRQDLPPAFVRDGSVYLTKTDILLKQHSLFGESIAFMENTHHPHVNIDTQADWELAEKYAADWQQMNR